MIFRVGKKNALFYWSRTWIHFRCEILFILTLIYRFSIFKFFFLLSLWSKWKQLRSFLCSRKYWSNFISKSWYSRNSGYFDKVQIPLNWNAAGLKCIWCLAILFAWMWRYIEIITRRKGIKDSVDIKNFNFRDQFLYDKVIKFTYECQSKLK